MTTAVTTDSSPQSSKPDSPLLLSAGVITSSSYREVGAMVGELRQLAQLDRIDLFLLRETDITDINTLRCKKGVRVSPQNFDSIAEVIDEFGSIDAILDWIHEWRNRLGVAPPQISALATYFPGIVSVHPDPKRRELACKAVAKSVQIALRLARQKIMPAVPVVEIVCGSVLDRCGCSNCACSFGSSDVTVFEYEHDFKCRELLQSLRKAVQLVREDPECVDGKFALALEYEPGESYLLNSISAVKKIDDYLNHEDFEDLCRTSDSILTWRISKSTA